MGHRVRLIIGEAVGLQAYRTIAGDTAFYRLRPDAHLLVLPVDDEFLDRMHGIYGTGDWCELGGPMLSSTDMSFAAHASERAPIGYIETDYFGGDGLQHAVLWRAGQLAIGPVTLDVQLSRQRPTTLWPINVVLRALGVNATHLEDEFTRVGLHAYRSNDDIIARAFQAT